MKANFPRKGPDADFALGISNNRDGGPNAEFTEPALVDDACLFVEVAPPFETR